MAVVAAAEWLRAPAALPVGVAVLGFLGGLALLYPVTGWRRRGLVVSLLGLAFALTFAQRRLTAIETGWPDQREQRVEAASGNGSKAISVPPCTAPIASLWRRSRPRSDDRVAAIATLDRLVPSRGTEMSVAVLDSAGDAVGLGWPTPPCAPTRKATRSTRGRLDITSCSRPGATRPTGAPAVASVLVWAHPAVPDRSRSLAELFRERHRGRAHGVPSRHCPGQRRRLRLRRADHRGTPAAVQRAAGAAGAGDRQADAPSGVGAERWPGSFCFTVACALSLASRPVERFALLDGTALARGARADRLRARPPAVLLSRDLLPPARSGRCRARQGCSHSRARSSRSRASGSGTAGFPGAGQAS